LEPLLEPTGAIEVERRQHGGGVEVVLGSLVSALEEHLNLRRYVGHVRTVEQHCVSPTEGDAARAHGLH
jgi:hypothetical protein